MHTTANVTLLLTLYRRHFERVATDDDYDVMDFLWVDMTEGELVEARARIKSLRMEFENVFNEQE